MKYLLTTLMLALLAAPATAQERPDIGNHAVFEQGRMARLALDYQEAWWIVAGLAFIGVVVCDFGWAARYVLRGLK